MKRIISFAAALAVVSIAASCKKDDLKTKADDVQVVFDFAIPQETVTKAEMSDGSTVDVLFYEIYAGGQFMSEGEVKRGGAENFSLTVKLVKGMEYDLLFWAQKKGTGYYNTDDLQNVTVNYDGLANDETRDAFYGSYPDFIAGTTPGTVYLYRPFAQVNFGAAPEDWARAEPFVMDGTDVNIKSSMTIENVYSAFNVMTGDVVANSFTDVEFDLNDAPIAEITYTNDYISHNQEEYAWVAMNYILAPSAGANVDLSADFVHMQNAATPLEKAVPQVPVKQNHRTNILGDIFTEGNTFQIVIVPGFTDDIIKELN